MTVTGLTTTSDNPVNGVPTPLNFTVTGTSGPQTANVALTIFFADFSLSASPTLNTVTAGQSASYTVTVTPYNSFNYVVLLSCAASLPQQVTCSWGPSAVTLSGTKTATAIGRGWLPLSLRLAGLGAVLCVITAGIGCNNYTYGPNITQSNTGTPTGNYTISIIGILGNNNSVSRTTTVNLSVGPG